MHSILWHGILLLHHLRLFTLRICCFHPPQPFIIPVSTGLPPPPLFPIRDHCNILLGHLYYCMHFICPYHCKNDIEYLTNLTIHIFMAYWRNRLCYVSNFRIKKSILPDYDAPLRKTNSFCIHNRKLFPWMVTAIRFWTIIFKKKATNWVKHHKIWLICNNRQINRTIQNRWCNFVY